MCILCMYMYVYVLYIYIYITPPFMYIFLVSLLSNRALYMRTLLKITGISMKLSFVNNQNEIKDNINTFGLTCISSDAHDHAKEQKGAQEEQGALHPGVSTTVVKPGLQ